MDEYESLSHTKWDCKYHVVFIPKCRRKTLYGEPRGSSWGSVSETGCAEGEPDRGGAFDARSCAYDDRDPAETRGVSGGRIHQGQKRHPYGAGVWREKTKFRWAALLGQRIFRFDRGARRGSDPGIYPQPGKRRRALGTVEPALSRCRGLLSLAHFGSRWPWQS